MNPADVAAKIVEHGILGTLLVAAAIVIYKLYGQLAESQKARLAESAELQKARSEDARAYQEQLLKLTGISVQAITNATSAAEASKEALDELRVTLREYAEERRKARRSP